MTAYRSTRDIAAMMKDPRWVQEALAQARRDMVRRHRLLGIPLVIWRDGKVSQVPADEFDVVDDSVDDR